MKATTLNIGPGVLFKVGDELYCVKRWETADSVAALHVATRTERIISLAEITESRAKELPEEQIDLQAIEKDDWDEVLERYEALSILLDTENRTRSDVKAVAEQLVSSTATVYRWLDRLEKFGTVTCLFRKRRSDKGKKRLPDAVEQIIKFVIEEEYLDKLKKSPTKALRSIELLCREKKIKAPSKGALLARIEEIIPEERENRREGRNAALRHRPNRGSLPGVDHVHAIWQIDHTLVDIELVDEKDRIAIGRPWITVAIDVFSRMVVGWYISIDPPGALATGLCIARAILPKNEFLAKLGIGFSWPCQGKPRIIHADNAREFRGKMLQNACQEHSFDMKFRKVKKPNYGAHIERLLGTLLEDIHGIEGTTFSNPQERGEYDSAANAIMTLDDFELWLANLILGKYHNNTHGTLKCAPIKRYNDGILGDDDSPGIGFLPIEADPEKLKIDFMPMEERTIQTDGVVLDLIKYHSPVLDRWIGARGEISKKVARKFIFRRDPRDISYLVFWDPDARQYYRIPYRDTSHPPISLWELRAIKAFLTAQNKQDIDEESIFAAYGEMRRIEEQAKELTRKQRRERERRKQHQKKIGSPKIATASPPVMPDEQLSSPSSSDQSIKQKKPKFDPYSIKPFDEVERL